jgi:NarL family two-component system response regulator LiaR
MESRHQPISVLLAEDHALVREGTRQMLERHDVITVVGEAVDGETAIEMTRDLRPDVLVLETASSEDLYAAILAVARGEVVLHPAIAAKVLEAHPEHAHDHVMTLSDRELEVLSHASRGLRTADIADVLSVSSRTVESHFTSIYNKLGVANRTAAVLHAASQGWIAADRDE